MFTIKVVERSDGEIVSEQVFEASGVRSEPNRVHVDLDSGCATYDVSQASRGDSSQHIYVMNRFGATVADYRL